MELLLKQHRSFVEKPAIFYGEKDQNIFYEEGPLPNDQKVAAMEMNRVLIEAYQKNKIDTKELTLTIIDPYFFAVEQKDAQKVIDRLKNMLKDISIENYIIYYRHKAPTPRMHFFNKETQTFEQKFRDNFCHTKTIRMSKKVHDRFWIFNKDAGIIVGTSLNSIGKNFSFVSEISTMDLSALIGDLKKYKIEV